METPLALPIPRYRRSPSVVQAQSSGHARVPVICTFTVFNLHTGTLKFPVPERRPIGDIVRERGSPDAETFTDFLQLMLTLDPAKRASFEELLAHRWLKEYVSD